MEELSDFLFQPGRQLEEESEELKTLSNIIKMILDKTYGMIM